MKNILLVIFISCCCNAKAQSSICPAINNFVGEWRYVNGQDTIRIYLRASDYTITGDGAVTIAKLWGWHEYKNGNMIIESNYSNRYMTLPTNSDNDVLTNSSISLQIPYCDLSRLRLRGGIYDISQCYERKNVTAIFNTAQTQLIWKQIQPTGFGLVTGCKGMTLPSNFVLTKQ